MITIQEILGTDSIAASRLTINSNFLLIENELNDFENTFNINVVTGSMDVSQATSGQVKTKSLYSNQMTLPSSGTSTINLYGTGASAGSASFSGKINAAQLQLSATGSFNQINASGPAVFDSTVQFNGNVTHGLAVINGPTGSFREQNAIGASGPTNTFIAPGNGGGGITGTFSNPYPLTFTESTIYADCGWYSQVATDSGYETGFFFYVVTGDGGTASSIPQGYRITIINTNSNAGLIGTGATGPIGSVYYTGFSTGNGQYHGAGISVPAYLPYRTSVTLQWENRISKTSTAQKGSWVVISSTGFGPGDI
jgi:hypothetical protein